MALSSRRLPSLLRVPASPVPRSRRYYEGATTSHRVSMAAYWFASTAHGYLLVRVRLRAPGRTDVLFQARALGQPVPDLSGSLYVDANGISQVFRRSLPVPLLRSGTPVEPTCPRHTGHVD